MGRSVHAVALLLFWFFSTMASCTRFEPREPSKPRSKLFRRQTLGPSHNAAFKMHHMQDARAMASSRWQETQASSVQSAKVSSSDPLIFFPTSNGADPTGHLDSTSALQLTIKQAFEVASPQTLMKGITDLGGVEVHLGGGQYTISKPLTLPEAGGGNVVIHGGTLRATSSFPSDRFLIELGSHHDQPAFEDIIFQDLLLDANYSAGGILLNNPLRTTIANCYITHFSSIGISVHGGHETFIHNSFLGQHITTGGDPGEKSFSGTAILLASNDNALTDVVIFSAQTGVEILGQANILSGVHCYNKATGWGGVGIMLRQGATLNRILGCYLDWTGIVLEETKQITITNSFFLGDAFVLLKSPGGTSSSSVFGVLIVDNIFSGNNHGVAIVQVQGNFSHVQETCVDNNSATGMAIRSTRAHISTSGYGSEWTVDLSKTLLFPSSIAHVQYSFFASNSTNHQNNATKSEVKSKLFPQHAIRSVTASSITVASDSPTYAIVSFYVDQSFNGDNDNQGMYLSM